MPGIESLTTTLVSTALDAASLRQQVIAANVANAGRADYAAQRVSFAATLGRLSQGSADPARTAVELRMRIVPERASDGSAVPVRLDTEMGALAQNGVHYQALVKGLNKYLSVMANAVSEGRR